MAKYSVTLISEYEVEAENVAHAVRVARARIRSIGEAYGGSRAKHERDSVRHCINRVSESLGLPRRIG